MSPLARLRYAAKVGSWPKLLVPFVLGQAIGWTDGSFDFTALGLGLLFAIFDVLFIVFLNDFGDRAIDTLKRRRFPNGSSKKTIPDGILPAWFLLLAGLLSGAAALATALWIDHALDRPYAIGFGILALAVFVAYTFPPLKLNYRGGGELLEMIGVGVLLPVMSAYIQSGSIGGPGYWLLPGYTILSLSSAVASGLSDERSDRAGGKRTVVAQLGNRFGRKITEAIYVLGAATLALFALVAPNLPSYVGVLPALIACFHFGALFIESGGAETDRPKALGRYKLALHRGIWRAGGAAAMLLAWSHLSMHVLRF